MFRVTAESAVAIETDILKWWGGLGLPSYLARAQMPQGGWTGLYPSPVLTWRQP